MPGYINYWLKDGKLSAYTKEKFKEYNQGSTGIPAPDTAGIWVFTPAPAPAISFSKSRPRLAGFDPGPAVFVQFCRNFLTKFCTFRL